MCKDGFEGSETRLYKIDGWSAHDNAVEQDRDGTRVDDGLEMDVHPFSDRPKGLGGRHSKAAPGYGDFGTATMVKWTRSGAVAADQVDESWQHSPFDHVVLLSVASD